jgi:hypothetical protein
VSIFPVSTHPRSTGCPPECEARMPHQHMAGAIGEPVPFRKTLAIMLAASVIRRYGAVGTEVTNTSGCARALHMMQPADQVH